MGSHLTPGSPTPAAVLLFFSISSQSLFPILMDPFNFDAPQRIPLLLHKIPFCPAQRSNLNHMNYGPKNSLSMQTHSKNQFDSAFDNETHFSVHLIRIIDSADPQTQPSRLRSLFKHRVNWRPLKEKRATWREVLKIKRMAGQ